MIKLLQVLEALTKSNVWCLINPVHIFLSGSADTRKSHLVRTINQAVSK